MDRRHTLLPLAGQDEDDESCKTVTMSDLEHVLSDEDDTPVIAPRRLDDVVLHPPAVLCLDEVPDPAALEHSESYAIPDSADGSLFGRSPSVPTPRHPGLFLGISALLAATFGAGVVVAAWLLMG